MTMVATLLAGLSTSEMTRAQYDRSLAAQLQSKAGDQWSFFQAKRLRGALQQNTAEALSLTDDPLLTSDQLAKALRDHSGKSDSDFSLDPTLATLSTGHLPTLPTPVFDPTLQAALDAVSAQRPETEIAPLLKKVKSDDLAAAVQACKDAAIHYDEVFQPLLHNIESLANSLGASAIAPTDNANAPSEKNSPKLPRISVRKTFAASRLAFSVRRYEAEARLNQTLANLYELQVRQSNLSADRHYLRSQRFFFGMLFAQFSVIMSTFAIAVRMKNTLWTLAAVAGIFAVAFALYVYLWV